MKPKDKDGGRTKVLLHRVQYDVGFLGGKNWGGSATAVAMEIASRRGRDDLKVIEESCPQGRCLTGQGQTLF